MTGTMNEEVKKAVLAGDCDNPLYQGYLVNYHEISAQDFDDMRKAYFAGSTLLPPVEVTIDLTGSACDEFHLEFAYKDDTSDNNVTVNIVEGADEGSITVPKDPTLGIAAYSLCLFNGIISTFNPDKFLVSKALDDNGSCVVVQVVANSKNVYFCDLSHEFPIAGPPIMHI